MKKLWISSHHGRGNHPYGGLCCTFLLKNTRKTPVGRLRRNTSDEISISISAIRFSHACKRRADLLILWAHMKSYEGSCRWCERELVRLFDIDLTVRPLPAFPIKAARINVATCDVCTCYGFVFAKLAPGGKARWSEHNRRPDYLPDSAQSWDRMPADRLILNPEPRPALHASDWLLPTKFSQIGGHPTWIQDAEYPACPGCQRTMIFLAQVSRDEIEEPAEGIYYSFICLNCWITATSYQQT